MSPEDELREIMDKTEAALGCLVEGDPEPFKALFSHAPDVTVFGGFGGFARGWEQVSENTSFAAGRFSGRQSFEVELLASGMSGDLAYAIWIERGQVRVVGKEDFAPLVVRVTHLFRREDGAWKLIHRHGDTVVEKVAATAILQK